MNAEPFRASDLGPADDPDERARDEINEDEDVQEAFVTANAGRLIALIETPDHLTALLAEKVRKLKTAWCAHQFNELENRRDV